MGIWIQASVVYYKLKQREKVDKQWKHRERMSKCPWRQCSNNVINSITICNDCVEGYLSKPYTCT